jgi:hypothetical protein
MGFRVHGKVTSSGDYNTIPFHVTTRVRRGIAAILAFTADFPFALELRL